MLTFEKGIALYFTAWLLFFLFTFVFQGNPNLLPLAALTWIWFFAECKNGAKLRHYLEDLQ